MKRDDYMKCFLSVILITSFVSQVYASPIDDAAEYSVRIKSAVRYAFAEEHAGASDGAGFLIDKKRGWILTNAHVSGYGTGVTEISFKGHDFQDARPVYVDSELDVAVLQIPAKKIPPSAIEAKLDCEDRPLNGVAVAAYGHPHGLTYSATRGIISRVRHYHGSDWVQTDAAINPGNSGGPLIDLNLGVVVGVNAMTLEDTQGLSFAVPTRPICKIISLMRAGKNPSPPMLPISFAVNEASEEYLIVGAAQHKKLPQGFMLGDRISKVGEAWINTPTDLTTYLRGKTGNVTVLLRRGDKELKADLNFVPKPKLLNRQYILADGALITEDVYPERWERENFYQVHSVRQGSFAERAGLLVYGLIMSIDGVRPTSLLHLKELLTGEDGKTIIFRRWSVQDTKFYDYHEVRYWPYEVELRTAGVKYD